MHLRKVIAKILPEKWISVFKISRILLKDYAYIKSLQLGKCVDTSENPIPWYTYPCWEYIRQLNWKDARVFEYGSGSSTLFWSQRAKKVVAVESAFPWYKRVKKELPGNCRILLKEKAEEYIAAVEAEEYWDVIVIDGPVETRTECAQKAVNHLASGGVVILDNADWCREAGKVLKSAGLIQVDFTGFGPLSPFTWTTSLFLDRNFNRESNESYQPQFGIGASEVVVE